MRILADAAAAFTTGIRILLASSALLLISASSQAQKVESLDNFPQKGAEIGSREGPQRFTIWIADTPARSEQGLMFVRSLGHDRGMLFPRNNAGPMTMWMKNTLIPLDMLFLDTQGQIIFIRHSATPQSEAIIQIPAPMVTPAQAVLELAGGECDRRHIFEGDRVSLVR
jgi:uncharacterized membrane protein (UPF0127 family)